MHTITVYPKRRPSLEEIEAFTRSFPPGEPGALATGVRRTNGDWVTPTRGVVESDDGRVYVDYDDRYREYFDKYLDVGQRAELTARLGFSPSLALHVQVSTGYQHSRELAQAVCDALVKQWGGVCSDGATTACKAPDVER